jgi:protein-disulfide isomerase
MHVQHTIKEVSNVKQLSIFAALACVMTLCVAQAGLAAGSSDDIKSLKNEIQTLKEADQQWQLKMEKELLEIKSLIQSKELQDIKNLLQAGPPSGPPVAAAPPAAPENVVLSIDGAPVKGNKDAPVTLIEFTDFQCPFCGRHFKNTLPQLETDYIKTGKVKYALLNFPLESLHPNAFKAAEAADCAGEQGKFWEMHDQLFENQRALDAAKLPDYAKAAGLDVEKFNKCLESGKFEDQVRKAQAEGQKAGVTGTPSFFLGMTDPKSSEVKVARTIKGAQAFGSFKAAIDSLLDAKK